MPRRTTLVLILLLITLLGACTTRTWYDGARTSAENECRRLPPGAYEDCMSRVPRQSYESYEKERTRQ